MIVGTAGHIDHGKTALVRALTGIDTDRLKEEQARGITIELGFAYWPRPDGAVVGFVDVPGHERLVHTMLAGAAGIDLVLLVVAADDGVMPQTREHLAILDLLGIAHGAVVLSKHDLVDEARSAQVQAEIRAALSGTGLADAPILPASAVTGAGLAEIGAFLDAARATVPARAGDGAFRLAVDRVFTLAGAGTVVTGTVLSGGVAPGDAVVIGPGGLEARVRSLHAQNRKAERGTAGQRCALALVGPRIERTAVARGDVVQAPHLHAPTRRVDARLTLLGSEARPLRQWAPVHVHHGAADVTGRVVLLAGDALAPGQTALVQLALDSDMALAAGDRFVLRDAGASRTIGGGVLLDLRPPERGRRAAQRLADLEALAAPQAEAAALALLGQPGRALDLGTLLRDRARPPEAAARLVAAHGLVALGDGFGSVMAAESWGGYAAALGATLDAHHAAHPDLPGLGAERLRLSLAPRLPMPAFAAALDRLRRESALVVDRAWVRRPGHEVRFSAEEEAVWSLLRARLGGAGRFRPPRVRDMARAMGQDEAMLRRLCRMAARRGDAEEIAQDHFFLAGTVAEMACTARALAEVAQDGRFNAVAFRDRLDNGRKVAIHILEFFDRHGLTMRRGDWRRINPHKANLFTQPASTEAAE